MIAKVPPKKKRNSSFKRLIDYMTERERVNQEPQANSFESDSVLGFLNGVSVVQSGSAVVCEHNCLSLETAALEMEAVANKNTRVKDPVYHFILSWPTGEVPTQEQAFECGRHAMKSVGMEGHQYVFAIHQDTKNVHLHASVNRVHPQSFLAVYPDRDFYKLDYAMRELELRFGWSHDQGPYSVFGIAGKQSIDWSIKEQNTKQKKPTAAADMERHSDQESLFSYVRGKPKDRVVALLKRDDLSWSLLHEELYRHGLELREKGRGFALYDLSSLKTTPLKASDLHEDMSKGRLVQRLGAFVPCDLQALADVEKVSTYDKLMPPKRNQDLRDERRLERAEMRRLLKAKYEQYKVEFVYQRLSADDVKTRFLEFRANVRAKRQEVKSTVRDPQVRKAMFSVIAFEAALAKQRLKKAIQEERDELRALPENRRKSYKTWVEEQAVMGDKAAISQVCGFEYSKNRRQKRAKD